ncbi:MAG: hypothetical protein HY951_18195 [Bacteroidia bacterium]|nr:hypothetical protein [Bacteroidia bacterium]
MKNLILVITLFAFIYFTISVNAQETLPVNKNNDSIEYTLNGTIASKTGKTVNIKINNQRTIPTVGQTGILQKYFEEEIFGMKTTGWLDIGKMKVTSVKPDMVSMTIIEEHSVVTKNGQKVDNFKIGKIVNFNWKTVK